MAFDFGAVSSVLNVVIAGITTLAAVIAVMLKLRKWQQSDVKAILRGELGPIIQQQTAILNEQQTLHQGLNDLGGKLDKLQSTVSGHESRLSFVEGKEAARAEFRGAAPPVELTDPEGGGT